MGPKSQGALHYAVSSHLLPLVIMPRIERQADRTFLDVVHHASTQSDVHLALSLGDAHVQAPLLGSIEQYRPFQRLDVVSQIRQNLLLACHACLHVLKPDREALLLRAPQLADFFKTLVVIYMISQVLRAHVHLGLENILFEDFNEVHSLLPIIPVVSLRDPLQGAHGVHYLPRRSERVLVVAYIPEKLVDVPLYVPLFVPAQEALELRNGSLLLHQITNSLAARQLAQHVSGEFQEGMCLCFDFSELPRILAREPRTSDLEHRLQQPAVLGQRLTS